MAPEDERILAITECLLIWDAMPDTGVYVDKGLVIAALYSEDKIHKGSYYFSCPLCDLYNRYDQEDDSCEECPWPGDKYRQGRCQDDEDSPYHKWCNGRGSPKAVFDLIKTFK